MPQEEWARVFDQPSQSYYYWHLTSYEVTWETPLHFDPILAAKQEREAAGLSISQVPGGLALLLATRKIQAVYRSKRARRTLHAWSHVFDPNKNTYYYWNSITYDTTWSKPPGYSEAEANKRERDAAGLGINQLPHGLGLLIATRKIQSAYRKKQARKKSRRFNAEQADSAATGDAIWIRMDDPSSGFPYWYHRETHQVTWDNPAPKPTGDREKDHDRTVFHPERSVLVLVASYLQTEMEMESKFKSKPDTDSEKESTGPSTGGNVLLLLSKHLTRSIALSKQMQQLQNLHKLSLSSLIQCGSLMALKIRGHAECEAIANVLNALRIMDGAMHPTPHFQNKIEKFKLSTQMLLYRGNRRWLQKNRIGLIGNMTDIVWLSSAMDRVVEISESLEGSLHTLGALRDINPDAAYLWEYVACFLVGVGTATGEEQREEKGKEDVRARDGVLDEVVVVDAEGTEVDEEAKEEKQGVEEEDANAAVEGEEKVVSAIEPAVVVPAVVEEIGGENT